MDTQQIIAEAADLANKIEGPYKWYIIGGIVFIFTLFVTKFIFRTFKWAILLLLFGMCVFGVFLALSRLTGL